MKIEKDAEWLRLEGRVGQLRGDLATAEQKLRDHAATLTAKQLGLVLGETVVECGGDRFIVSSVDSGTLRWVKGRKIRKDGKPSDREQHLFSRWKKVDV